MVFLGAAALLLPALANEDEPIKGIFTLSYERAELQAGYVGYANQRVVDIVALGESPARVSAAIAGKDGIFLQRVCGEQNTETPQGIQNCISALREFRNDIFRHSRSQSAIADSVDSFARYMDDAEGPEGFDLLRDLKQINARISPPPEQGGEGTNIRPGAVPPANQKVQEDSSIVAALLNATEISHDDSITSFDFRIGDADSVVPSAGRSAGGITDSSATCEEEGEIFLFGQCVNFNENHAGEVCGTTADGYVEGCLYGQLTPGQPPNRHATDIELPDPPTLLSDRWTQQADAIQQTNTQITENQNHFFALSKTHNTKYAPEPNINVESMSATSAPPRINTNFMLLINQEYSNVSTQYGACPEGADGCPLETGKDCETLLGFVLSEWWAFKSPGQNVDLATACQREIKAFNAARKPAVPDVLSGLPADSSKLMGARLTAAIGNVSRSYASYQQAIATISTQASERASLACQVAGS